MDVSNLKPSIEAFKKIVEESKNIVGFTGAGISTDSGIPDYRSKGGIWDKFRPVYIDEFLNDSQKRILYWERKVELWDGIKNAEPGRGHFFFKNIYDTGKLTGIITQNIDGLHEKSTLPKEIIVNLHGSNLEVVCLSCSDILDAHIVFDSIDLSNGVPLCNKCGGFLKPNTISFGQSLIEKDLQKASEMAYDCELMIVIGSTLTVHPAAHFPVIAKNSKAKLVIITLSETPLDNMADLVFNCKINDFLDLYES